MKWNKSIAVFVVAFFIYGEFTQVTKMTKYYNATFNNRLRHEFVYGKVSVEVGKFRRALVWGLLTNRDQFSSQLAMYAILYTVRMKTAISEQILQNKSTTSCLFITSFS